MGNKLNKETKWISACLIGVGKHSQTKLIPALKKAGITKEDYPRFEN